MIQEQNIVFLESQVMDDVPEGGGAATNRVVIDGAMNNIFPDVSDLDRALGRFQLRKIFLAIRTLDTDMFGGAKTAITRLPADDSISYTVFTTHSAFDTRSQAVDRVQAYLYKGPQWPGVLWENHIAGMRAIRLVQRVGTELPPVGKTLCLVQFEGQPTEREQYVRVIRVSVAQRTFTDSMGDYYRQEVTLDLSDALRHDFAGHTPNRFDDYDFSLRARVRDTTVADAMRFYGAQRVTHAAQLGDHAIRAASIFTQLVPASRSETALTDQSYAQEFRHVLATSPRTVAVNAAPMSVRVKITAENRGYNYTAILKPLPAPGSVRIVYRAQGNTYTMADDGNGLLAGAGSGTVSSLTGSVVATLDALPDVGSAVVIYYGPNRAYTNRSGQATFRPPAVRITLDHQHIDPGTFSISWSSGGQTKTLTDNGLGQLTGDGEGVLIHALGEVWMVPAAFPDGGSQYDIEYEHSPVAEELFPGLTPDAAGFVQFTLSDSPVPGSMEITWAVSRITSVTSGSSADAASTAKRVVSEAVQVPQPGQTFQRFSLGMQAHSSPG